MATAAFIQMLHIEAQESCLLAVYAGGSSHNRGVWGMRGMESMWDPAPWYRKINYPKKVETCL